MLAQVTSRQTTSGEPSLNVARERPASRRRIPAVEALVADAADDKAVPRRPARVLHLITSLERGGAENHLLALLGHADRHAFSFETAVLSGAGELVGDIALQGKPAMSFPDADTIIDHLAPELRENDVVAIMSNGGFGGIHEKLLNVLNS